MVQKLLKKGTNNVTNLGQILGPFWVHFGSILGFVLGSVLGLEWAKMRQDDSHEDIKNLEVPKSCICKNIKKPLFFFKVFGVQRPPKMSIRGSGRLPRGT